MRSKLKHTPGPWKVMPGSLNFPKLLVRAPQSDKAIADCDYQQGEEGEANARLIASAPNLLEALKRALACIQDERPGTAAKVIRKAIMDAEGEGIVVPS